MAHTWMTDAACLWEDPELFFPVGVTGPAITQEQEAKLVCRSCPVVEPCLLFALAGRFSGVWGGLSEAERDALRRRRQRQRLAQRPT